MERLNTTKSRDSRHTIYKTSRNSLSNGPIYFNCFPDPLIMEILTLDILTHNYRMLPGSHIYGVFYRLQYRVMNIGLCSNAINHNKLNGYTIF